MALQWFYDDCKGYDYKLTNKVLDAMMVGGDTDHGVWIGTN